MNGDQGRNRTTDTRIFSIQLRLSSKFSVDLCTLVAISFQAARHSRTALTKALAAG